ncbi:MAG: hypothetical protein ACE5KE_00220 [Methanosarcinales archaeon]
MKGKNKKIEQEVCRKKPFRLHNYKFKKYEDGFAIWQCCFCGDKFRERDDKK